MKIIAKNGRRSDGNVHSRYFRWWFSRSAGHGAVRGSRKRRKMKEKIISMSGVVIYEILRGVRGAIRTRTCYGFDEAKKEIERYMA